MKKKPCSYAKCKDYRIHHERPDEPRGVQWVEVPDGHEGKAYCSITCACLAGAMSVRSDVIVDKKREPEPDVTVLDKILHERGWAITLEGVGYLEGPKWWNAHATAMGCICPRTVEVKKAGSIKEAIEEIRRKIEEGYGPSSEEPTT